MMWVDFETRSKVDLKNRGAYLYAKDPSTEVICMAYAFDDGDVILWTPDMSKFPDEVRKYKGQIRAHNAGFERLIFWYVLGIKFLIEQFYCTAAQSRSNCMPGALGDVGRFCNTRHKKDYRGAQLIKWLCIPDDSGKFSYDPLLLDEMYSYCIDDVYTMRDVSKAQRDLSDEELLDYHVNERVNDLGILVDLDLCKSAVTYANEEKSEIEALVQKITSGEILKLRSPKTAIWVYDRVGPQARKMIEVYKDGEKKKCFDKNVRSNLLDLAEEDYDEIPPYVADMIQCTDDLWASSVAKFSKIVDRADPVDQRVRGSFIFAGGQMTGRASSHGIQLHNFARQCAKEPLKVRKAMMKHAELVPEFGEAVTDVLRGMLRPSLIAKPGHTFVLADWSAIEGRVNPWLANSLSGEAKLDQYRQGIDPYIINAAALYGVEYEDVSKDQRQCGKVQELACFSQKTRVLTDTGVKDITKVLLTDRLWDGEEWVTHQGVVQKGLQKTIDVLGVQVTPGHLIKTGRTWTPAEQLVSSESIRSLALETGAESLRCLVSTELSTARALRIWPKFSVRVGQPRTMSTCPAYAKAPLHGVTCVPRKRLPTEENSTMDTQTSCRTTGTGVGYSTVFQRALVDAVGVLTPRIITMAEGAYPYTPHGKKVRKGDVRTLRTWLLSKGGTSRSSTWIERTLMVIMRQVTCGSPLSEKTGPTREELTNCNRGFQTLKPVYDIMNAGPKNRFTILSDKGPLVVHNCGFLGGQGSFEAFMKAYQLSFSTDEINRAVRVWRRNNPWAFEHGNALKKAYTLAMRNPGIEFNGPRVTYLFDGVHLWYALPSGRILCYPFAKLEDDSVTYAKASRKPKADAKEWPRATIWPGLAVENCWSGDTKIVTKSGLKSISLIKATDEVWDGYAWVQHRGVTNNGKKDTVAWLGTHVTKSHRIHDGKQWNAVIDLDEYSLNGCLELGRRLAPQNWSGVTSGRGTPVRLNSSVDIMRSYTTLKEEKQVMKLQNTIGTHEVVYDILDCGPRHQYMVMTSFGPVIAHNCTQATANDILRESIRELDDLFFDIPLHVHDEIGVECLLEDAEYVKAEMEKIMTKSPAWAVDLPLKVETTISARYKK